MQPPDPGTGPRPLCYYCSLCFLAFFPLDVLCYDKKVKNKQKVLNTRRCQPQNLRGEQADPAGNRRPAQRSRARAAHGSDHGGRRHELVGHGQSWVTCGAAAHWAMAPGAPVPDSAEAHVWRMYLIGSPRPRLDPNRKTGQGAKLWGLRGFAFVILPAQGETDTVGHHANPAFPAPRAATQQTPAGEAGRAALLVQRLTRRHQAHDTTHRLEGQAGQETELEADPGPLAPPGPGCLLHEVDVVTEPPGARLRARRAAFAGAVPPPRQRLAAGARAAVLAAVLPDGRWLHALVPWDPGEGD